MALPSVIDLKAHLNITNDLSDIELDDMLDAAFDVVSGVVGPVVGDTVTETHYGLSSGLLILRQTPAVALTAVSSRSGAITTALTLTDYELDPATGIVRTADGGWFYGNYVVTYSVGWESTMPAAIRLAILVVAGHLWETQRGSSPQVLALSQDGDPSFTPGRGFALPNRALELLAPFARANIA